MIVAQISDLHIKRKGKLLHHMVNTARFLRRCVDRLNALDPRPDAVVATGDLTDSGKPKEYKRLRKILADLAIPLYLLPGNHDEREQLRAEFGERHEYLPAGPYLHYTVERFALRLVCLDSTAPGMAGGVLDLGRLTWLDARLSEAPARPTMIFMHHPPFPTGVRSVDALGFRGLPEFAGIVARHPQIVRIACGHIHRVMSVPWQGTLACSAPSTSPQIVLQPRDVQPLGLALEPAGFVLHSWDAAGAVLHSRTQYLYDLFGDAAQNERAPGVPGALRS